MKRTIPACLIASLFAVTTSLSAQTIFTDDFSSGDFDGYSLTPSASSDYVGARIVDKSSNPANPFTGNAARFYDLSGEDGLYVQNDFSSNASQQLVQLMTFDAALATGPDSSEGILSFRLTNEGTSTSSKSNCVFDIQLRQSGLVKVYGATDQGFSNKISTSGSSFAVYTNSSNASITLTDIASNELTLGAGEFALYIDGERLGIWGNLTNSNFDPTEGIGRFGFVSTSDNVGSDVIVDNIEITAIPESSSSALLIGAGVIMFVFSRMGLRRRGK